MFTPKKKGGWYIVAFDFKMILAALSIMAKELKIGLRDTYLEFFPSVMVQTGERASERENTSKWNNNDRAIKNLTHLWKMVH